MRSIEGDPPSSLSGAQLETSGMRPLCGRLPPKRHRAPISAIGGLPLASPIEIAHESAREIMSIEILEVVQALPHAYLENGKVELVADG